MRDSKRDTCIEWTFRLCGRGRGWDDLGEWHWNIYYQVRNESPVYVRYRIQDAWGWCTGWPREMDDMGWKVGGGFRIGNSCTPVADSCWCTIKPIQYCKVNEKKKWVPMLTITDISNQIQGWFPLGLTALLSLLSKGLSRVFSNTTVQKHQFFCAQLSLYSNSYIHTWLLEKP